MPLALELAAARAGALSPAEIAARLGDALGLLRSGSRAGLTRQQTLRATLAWSHELLAEPEQALYRRLGVFAGNFGLPAVEGICVDATVPAGEVLELLLGLIEKSLVQVETGHGQRSRYRLLETIRQDAREHLRAAGESRAVRAGSPHWYGKLAAAADRDRDPGVAAEWPSERVEEEHDDLRVALASAIRAEPAAGLRLARSLWWFWMARGYFAEGTRWLEAALAAADETDPARPGALVALGAIDVRRQGAERSVSLGREALEIVRRTGDRAAQARALERFGVMAMGAFELVSADRCSPRRLRLRGRWARSRCVVAARQAQGVLAAIRGETAAARDLLAECLAQLGQIDEQRGPLFWAVHISPVVIPSGPGGALRVLLRGHLLPVSRGAQPGRVRLRADQRGRDVPHRRRLHAAREHLERAARHLSRAGRRAGRGGGPERPGEPGKAGRGASTRAASTSSRRSRSAAAAGDPRETLRR